MCVFLCVCSSTCCQLVKEQQCRLPTQLTAEQAAGLHRESVVVSQQQAADAEIGLCGVSQVGRLVGQTVIHVHFIALKTAYTGEWRILRAGSYRKELQKMILDKKKIIILRSIQLNTSLIRRQAHG